MADSQAYQQLTTQQPLKVAAVENEHDASPEECGDAFNSRKAFLQQSHGDGDQ